MAFNHYCIDAKTSYCPCELVESESCTVCSMLQGKDTCDCNWSGVCVYQNYLWNGEKAGNKRKSYTLNIANKKFIRENLLVLKVKVDNPEVFSNCNKPGTFAFLRAYNKSDLYDVPLCVMDIDEEKNYLFFAINIIGPKTKALARADKVIFRGPYFNGLLGIKHIKSSFKKRWLIIGRGIGQVSLVLLIKSLYRGKNEFDVFLDRGSLEMNIVQQKLSDMGISAKNIDSMDNKDEKIIDDFIRNNPIDFVCSTGSDIQHRKIQNIIRISGKKIPLIVSNNQKICCGEGVCGSCKSIVQDKEINLCKVQLDSNNIFGGYR